MEVKRGEVWWVSLDDSVGSEIKTGRPAVVLSSNGLNRQLETVIVAFMTTASYAHASHPQVVNPTGTKRRVLCEQLRTISKTRLTRYESTLTDEELARVTNAMAATLCMAPVVTGNQPTAASNEELLTLKAEVGLYRQLYERTLNQLVELKFEADLVKVKDSKTTVIEEEPEEPEEPEVWEPKYDPKEINTCSDIDLKQGGCTPELIENIIKNRPYKTLDELRRVPGVTAIAFGLLKAKFYCVPVAEPAEEKVEEEQTVFVPPTEKVNINTATSKEMSEKLGISLKDAYSISGYRKKNGLFVCLEELLEVDRVSKQKFERIKDWITIDDPVVETKPIESAPKKTKVEVEAEKINVNEANIRELMGVGFGKPEAGRIVNWVKKYGPFKSLDDLLQVDGVTGKVLRKLRDDLTV